MFGRIITLTLITFGISTCVRGAEFSILRHDAHGVASADVFSDGQPPWRSSGPLDEHEATTQLPDLSFRVSAIDIASPIGVGAYAGASGRSDVTPLEDELLIRTSLSAFFSSPGSPYPGGEAHSSLFSVIEFEMPADEIYWHASQQLRQRIPFVGLSSVISENVTTGETLLEFGMESSWFEGILAASIGDRIRITSNMWGSGVTPPTGSDPQFSNSVHIQFIVPEPTTLTIVAIAGAVILVSFPERLRRFLVVRSHSKRACRSLALHDPVGVPD